MFDRRLKIYLKLWKKRLRKSLKLNAIMAVAMLFVTVLSLSIYQRFHDEERLLSTFSLWQYTQQDLSPNEENHRSIASVNQCTFNEVSLPQIKNEVAQLERTFQTGSNLEGKFYGLDLNKLPSIGAQLLADNKDLIGDQGARSNYNFSACDSVACIFNELYGDDSKLSGYITYYWYLKTGTMLSLSNYVPEQKDHQPGKYSEKDFSYSDFLFNKSELVNFYHLAKSLPEKLTFVPLLKSIHKVPAQAKIEQSLNTCSFSLPKGQILMHPNCMNKGEIDFFINATREIAKYADRHEGLKLGVASISNSKYWLETSGWQKESLFNPISKETKSNWKSKLSLNDFVDARATKSPIEQFASIIAYYRFQPQRLVNKTPAELVNWVKKNIYHENVFDPSGLYKQFMFKVSNTWSVQEVGIWKKCMDQTLDPKKPIKEVQRELANSIDHPLYTCVEQKVPGFIDYAVGEIKKNQYEGCEFFTERHNNQYGHQLERFHQNIEKFIAEKILQRKIEFKRHGPEVLIGYEIKKKFVSTIDPKAVYISCFDKFNSQNCYETSMKSKLNQITYLHPTISKYYTKTLEDDILSLFPFDEVQKDTNEVTKRFLAPYSARLSQAATKIWDSCKANGRDEKEKLDFPLSFSGGRYFVNPKLVNCINSSLKETIYDMAELKAFHKTEDEVLEFKLKPIEQEFALSFLQGRLLQTLNNILEKEYLSEQIRLAQHFKEASLKALSQFSEDHDTFFSNVFSFNQVKKLCIEKINAFYPESYFYHPTEQIDIAYGHPLCEKFVNMPFVRNKLSKEVTRQWELNKDFAEKVLVEKYQTQIDLCYDDNPVLERGPSSAQQNRRNKYRRDSCLEISYVESINKALAEWRDHKNYQYFANKESQLYSHLKSLERKFVRAAQNNQKLK